jgi:hypothetical protein
MSPAKLSLAQSKIVSTGVWGKMNDDSYIAMARDEEDFNSERLYTNGIAELAFGTGLT